MKIAINDLKNYTVVRDVYFDKDGLVLQSKMAMSEGGGWVTLKLEPEDFPKLIALLSKFTKAPASTPDRTSFNMEKVES